MRHLEMRTITDATLYVVNGPRGPYYALRDNDSGQIITERTEQAAATVANEKDMVIVERLEISHPKMLAMMGGRTTKSLEDGIYREPHAPTR
jgi:hypothetical protein